MFKLFTQHTFGRPLVILMAALAVAAIGSLATVWMRHKITHVATSNRLLEGSLQQAERKLQFLESKIAQAHKPDVLERKTQGVLRPADAKQIVWLDTHSGVSRTQSQKAVRALEEPLAISFDLAFLATTAHP
ncbi:MAG TPA: hypothetical protein PLV25_04130 [Opitutales bacterium]|nr:hypothetical protein [Opitutales bacterium]